MKIKFQELAKKLGKKQVDIARDLGVTQPELSRLLNHGGTPRGRILANFEQVFGCSPDVVDFAPPPKRGDRVSVTEIHNYGSTDASRELQLEREKLELERRLMEAERREMKAQMEVRIALMNLAGVRFDASAIINSPVRESEKLFARTVLFATTAASNALARALPDGVPDGLPGAEQLFPAQAGESAPTAGSYSGNTAGNGSAQAIGPGASANVPKKK